MANQNVIEQARNLILTAQPEDVIARKTVWELLNENGLLNGRATENPIHIQLRQRVIRQVIAGEYVDPTAKQTRTFMAHLVLIDEALLPERLELSSDQLPIARAFFSAMDKDIRPE